MRNTKQVFKQIKEIHRLTQFQKIYLEANLQDGTLSKVMEFVEGKKVLHTEHGNI